MQKINRITPTQISLKLKKSEDSPKEPELPQTSYSPDEATDKQISENIQNQIKSSWPETAWPQTYKQATKNLSGPVKQGHGSAEESKANVLSHLDRENEGSNRVKVDRVHLYRSYKSTPHAPLSLALKYIVHRVENQPLYQDSAKGAEADTAFLKQHQIPGKSDAVTQSDLRTFLYHHPDLISGVLKMQREVHQHIHKYSPWSVKTDPKGRPAVNLTRALKVTHEERGPDHALASYADTSAPPFGTYKHHQIVPMKNLWYSYDIGPEEASSPSYGAEDEYLVSPHENQVYGKTLPFPEQNPDDVYDDEGQEIKLTDKPITTKKIMPQGAYPIGRHGGFESDVYGYNSHLLNNADKISAASLDKIANNGDAPYYMATKVFKNPNLTMDQAIKFNSRPGGIRESGLAKLLTKWSLKTQPTERTIGLFQRAVDEATDPKAVKRSFTPAQLTMMLKTLNGTDTEIDDPNGYVSGWVKKNGPEIVRKIEAYASLIERKFPTSPYNMVVLNGNIDDIRHAISGISSREYPVEKMPELKKTIQTPLLMANNIGKLIPKKDNLERLVETKELENGLFHHILQYNNNPSRITHAISRSADPNKPFVSKVQGYKDGNEFVVNISKVHPAESGKGFGKLAYLSALAHHGRITSDVSTSKFADKAWESLPSHHPGIVRTMGTPGTQEQHTATVDKSSQQSLKDKLYRPDYSHLNDKLVKSEIEDQRQLVKLDRTHEVTGLAGYSKDGRKVYIDNRIGEFKGHDVAKFLLVHEVTEKALEDKLGYGYETAHSLALRAEQRAVEEAGLSWEDYSHFMRSLMEKIGRAGQAKNVPADLENPSAEHVSQRVAGYQHDLKKSIRGNYEGDVHPHKPHLVWTKLKSGQMSWHPNKKMAVDYDKANVVNTEKYLATVPPEHKELVRSFATKIFSHPDRHAIVGHDKSGKWAIRARHMNAVFAGDPNASLSVTSPDTVELNLKSRHGQDEAENAQGSKWKYTKTKNSIENIP